MDAITQFLTDQGLWGLAVLALAASTKTLHTETKTLRSDHAAELKQLQKDHATLLEKERGQLLEILEEKEASLLEEREKRVAEQKAATGAVSDANVALKDTLDKLLAMKRSRSDPPNTGRG